MRVASFERIAKALQQHEVRYLLVGGMAAIKRLKKLFPDVTPAG
jgi:hypothetical protein